MDINVDSLVKEASAPSQGANNGMDAETIALLRGGRVPASLPSQNVDGSLISSARKARARRRYISVPTNLILTPTDITVQVDWTASNGISISGYKVLRDGVEVGDVPGVTYTDAGLTPSTIYTYEVYAYNGYHGTSGKVTGQTTTNPTP